MVKKIKTPGHKMVRIRAATWCQCGHYLGGLGFEDGYLPRDSRLRYALHRVQVINGQS